LFAGAIALLVINDHVLKAAWPGFVTGKLSDVAGVVMVAILLAALLRRPSAACGATAVAFVALKVVPIMPTWAAPVLGGATRTDPTDLMALMALIPLWGWLSVRDGDRRMSVRPADRRWLLPLQLLALTAATFATTATSCAGERVESIEVGEGGAIVTKGDFVFASVDGGWTWEPVEAEQPAERSQQACLSDGTCFSLRDESVLERHPGGDWEPSFAFTPGEVAAQERNADALCDEDPHDGFVAIAVVDAPSGENIVVTMGSQGVLVRTSDGSWTGRSVDGLGTISTSTFELGGTFARVLMAVPLVAAVAGIALAFGRDRRSGRKKAAALAAAAIVLCLGSYTMLMLVSFSRVGAQFDRALVTWAAVVAAIWIVLLSIEAWWLSRANSSTLPPPNPHHRIG
jgi:hypothetical protein